MGQTVSKLIAQRYPYTLALTLASLAIAVLQTLHNLPSGEAARIRIEPGDGRSCVGGDASMAGQEETLKPGRTGAKAASPVGKGSGRQTDSGRGAKFAEGSESLFELLGAGRRGIDSTLVVDE